MIELMILLVIFLITLLFYISYTSFAFQVWRRRNKYKTLIMKEIAKKTKATYFPTAHFATSHKLVSRKGHKSFSRRHKIAFSECYNAITFKTPEANWELFFHLVKEGVSFSEIITIRAFSNKYKIRSEANVERVHSRLNSVANNKYLADILESKEVKTYLEWLLKKNGEILLVSHNNLHFKAFVDTEKLDEKRIMEMIKVINMIHKKIYKSDVLEY